MTALSIIAGIIAAIAVVIVALIVWAGGFDMFDRP